MKSSPFGFPPELQLKSLSRYCCTICLGCCGKRGYPSVESEIPHPQAVWSILVLSTQVFQVLLKGQVAASMDYIHFQNTWIPKAYAHSTPHCVAELKPGCKKQARMEKNMFSSFLFLTAIKFTFLNSKWSWQRREVQWFWLNRSLKHSLPKRQSFEKTCYGNGRAVWWEEGVKDRQPL